MKTCLNILVAALLLSSCNTAEKATSSTYTDDVYYSSKDATADKENKRIQDEQRKAAEATRASENQYSVPANENSTAQGEQRRSTTGSDDYYQSTEKRTDSNGNTYVTNNYYDEPFNYDDYYDYEYTVRLKRFHHYTPSYSYYDNYYTNSYWYTGNPYTYGSSVYLGYNWWGPSYATYSYNPTSYWYMSLGWGYDPWYSPYGYHPYNPYGYYGCSPYYNPYMNGYANGYNNGYWDGYNNGLYNGYNNNYFNSYDNNSYYYGPRATTSANGRVTTQPTLSHRYIDAVAKGEIKPVDIDKGRDEKPHISNVNGNSTRPVNIDNPNSKPVNDANKPVGGFKPAVDTRPNTVQPKPFEENTPKPFNNAERPKPFNEQPKPVYEQQKPVYEQPKPVYEQPKPVYEKPKPVYEQPKPVYEQPKPVYEQPKYEQPKPRNEQPKYEQPKYEQPRYEQSAPAPRNNSNNNSSPRGPRR